MVKVQKSIFCVLMFACFVFSAFALDVPKLETPIMDKANVEIIAGLNLPMLIKLSALRKECNLKDAVIGAQDAGKKYINIASQLLGQ